MDNARGERNAAEYEQPEQRDQSNTRKRNSRRDRPPIDPLFNDAFIRIFGSSDSHAATRSLVNAVFRMAGIPEIGEIDSLSAEHTEVGESVSLRSARFDVLLVAGDRYVDLEAQRRDEDIEAKALFYAARLLVSHTRTGTSLKGLPQAVVVMLYEGPPLLPDDGRPVHTCRMRWDDADGRPSSDRMLFVLVEMLRVQERYNSPTEDVLADEALSWLYVLAKGYRDREELSMMLQHRDMPSIEEFARLYDIAIDDPEIEHRYDKYHEAILEYNSEVDYQNRLRREGREKALAEGRAEGLAEGREAGLAEGRAEGLAEGREAGLAEGRAEGRAEGLAEGREAGREEVAERLRALGVDAALIKQALDGSSE